MAFRLYLFFLCVVSSLVFRFKCDHYCRRLCGLSVYNELGFAVNFKESPSGWLHRNVHDELSSSIKLFSVSYRRLKLLLPLG
jgi:hypothetical protein